MLVLLLHSCQNLYQWYTRVYNVHHVAHLILHYTVLFCLDAVVH